jgi:hypothetical protein
MSHAGIIGFLDHIALPQLKRFRIELMWGFFEDEEDLEYPIWPSEAITTFFLRSACRISLLHLYNVTLTSSDAMELLLCTTASQNSNTFCYRCHKGEVYIMLQDITSTLILGQYFQWSKTKKNTSGLSTDWTKDFMHSFTSFWKWLAHLTIRPLWSWILTKFSTIYTCYGHVSYIIYMWWSIYVLGPFFDGNSTVVSIFTPD